MKRSRKKVLAVLAILALGPAMTVLPTPGQAAGLVQLAEIETIYKEPRAGEMILDGLLVRPVSFVATVIGSVVWVITLPFSAAGGNVGQAREKLIEGPAAFTFTRCLGCLRPGP